MKLMAAVGVCRYQSGVVEKAHRDDASENLVEKARKM